METVINHAGLLAGYAGKDKIEMDDMIQACLSVLFNVDETNRTPEYIERIAYHQAGHVVVSEMLQPESISFVSVWGEDYDDYGDYDEKGNTMYANNSDYFHDKKYMDTRIMSLLGGKMATEIKYGETDVCCNKDLTRAFNIAERYTDRYCSSSFDSRKDDYGNSDALLERSGMNIAFDIEHLYAKTRKLLILNREFLDKVASALIEKNTLIARDIAAIKATCKITVE